MQAFNRVAAVAGALALGVLAVPAARADDGLNIIKVGVGRVTIHNTTTGLTGIGVPAGADLDVGDATTLLFGYERMFSDNLGVELSAGLPPRHDVHGKGSIAFLGKTASVKQFAPTLFANYHFGQAGDVLRAHVGLGINYTKFFDTKSETPGQDIELGRSIGPAAQVGLTWQATKATGVWFNVATARVKSDMVATGATVQQTTINFKPVLFGLGLSWAF